MRASRYAVHAGTGRICLSWRAWVFNDRLDARGPWVDLSSLMKASTGDVRCIVLFIHSFLHPPVGQDSQEGCKHTTSHTIMVSWHCMSGFLNSHIP